MSEVGILDDEPLPPDEDPWCLEIGRFIVEWSRLENDLQAFAFDNLEGERADWVKFSADFSGEKLWKLGKETSRRLEREDWLRIFEEAEILSEERNTICHCLWKATGEGIEVHGHKRKTYQRRQGYQTPELIEEATYRVKILFSKVYFCDVVHDLSGII